MSNRIQISCNADNQMHALMLKGAWDRVRRDTNSLRMFEEDNRKTILIILVVKQNNIDVPGYLYNRLTEISHVIQHYKEALDDHYAFIREVSRKLVIC